MKELQRQVKQYYGVASVNTHQYAPPVFLVGKDQPTVRVKAVQKYGMVVRDKSGAVTLYAENPAGRYAEDPYRKPGGILRWPENVDPKNTWPLGPHTKGRLRGFPFDKLQMLKPKMNKPIPAAGPAGAGDGAK